MSRDRDYEPDDRSRDSRTIEWGAGVLWRYSDLLCQWEESQGCGWVELEYAVGNVVLHTAAAGSGHALLLLADRLTDELARHLDGAHDSAEPLSPSLVAEAIEAYSRLGGEIERHAQAVVAALDRLRAGRVR